MSWWRVSLHPGKMSAKAGRPWLEQGAKGRAASWREGLDGVVGAHQGKTPAMLRGRGGCWQVYTQCQEEAEEEPEPADPSGLEGAGEPGKDFPAGVDRADDTFNRLTRALLGADRAEEGGRGRNLGSPGDKR